MFWFFKPGLQTLRARESLALLTLAERNLSEGFRTKRARTAGPWLVATSADGLGSGPGNI